VAAFSEKTLAVDISDAAIKKARKKHRHNPAIEFRRADLVTENFSGETYDFIFCGEILYYFELQQFHKLVPKIIDLMKPDGKLLLVHIRSLRDDNSGLELKEFGAKTIHEAFIRHQALKLEEDRIEKSYRISLLSRIETKGKPFVLLMAQLAADCYYGMLETSFLMPALCWI
jgi:chemotaxis methyl-accepting protein methylase